MDRYYIASLGAALEVLEGLANSEGEWQRLTDLSKRVGMTKNRVFRILSTLARHGYVEQDAETQAYRLGLNLFRLGLSARSQLGIHQVAQPHLVRLAEATREVAHLLVRRGLYAICIGHHESSQRLLVSDQIGQPIPLHIGASPKVLLAFAPPAEREDLIARLNLVRYTELTLTTVEALRHALDEIVASGVSIDRGDYERDICAVGAPVFGAGGQVVAGVTVTCPLTRFGPDEEARIAAEVCRTAREISCALGFSG